MSLTKTFIPFHAFTQSQSGITAMSFLNCLETFPHPHHFPLRK